MNITTEYLPEYRDQVFQLIKEFEQESFRELGLELNPDTFDDAVESQKDSSFLMLVDGKVEGLLSGTLVNGFGLKGTIWQEVIWYVRKPYRKYGLKLFKMAYSTLKDRGVDAIMTAHLNNRIGMRIGRMYKRLGFRPVETHYIRRLDDGDR